MKENLVGLWREDRAEGKFVIEGRGGSPQYFSLLEMVVSNPTGFIRNLDVRGGG